VRGLSFVLPLTMGFYQGDDVAMSWRDTVLKAIKDVHPSARSRALTEDMRLTADLGMASMELVELAERLETKLGAEISLEDLFMGSHDGSLDIGTLIAWLDARAPRQGSDRR
jgi:acyl carrier protein